VLSVNSGEPRAFGERELRLLTELARHAQGALQNAVRYEQERRTAETLQQALLADELPRMPGLELAALYQPAAGSQVGGDFYSAWPMSGGRLALLVGDVSGKGVEAAGVTAMVRYMTEALSQHRGEPAGLVSELNDMLCPRMADGALVTLVMVVIDTTGERLHWCSAGHPPPAILTAGGTYLTLEDPDPPCGVFPGQRFHGGIARFAPGDMLFTYTDGLIEARRGDEEFGEDRLREAVLDAAGEAPDRLAHAVYAPARTWSQGRLTDDVAIAVVKRVPVRLLVA
jgi:serine phosphatase RsbU (regulator of sigma subunit)